MKTSTMTETTQTEWKEGDLVGIKGQQGIFKVMRNEPNRDGSISLYGGDENPNGCRGFRDIMPDRLKPKQPRVKRRSIKPVKKGGK